MSDMDRIRTLIVEDYAFFRRSLRAHLEENCNALVVGMASNGPDAVAFADELGPDLLLMNAHLPGMDSLEACRKVKAHTPGMTIILYTPYDPDIYVRRPGSCADACMAQDSLFDELPPTIQELFSQGNQPLNRCIS